MSGINIKNMLIVLSVSVMVASCGSDKPGSPDGSNNVTLMAMDTSGVYGEEWAGLPDVTIRVTATNISHERLAVTDAIGRAFLKDLPAGDYIISAEKQDQEKEIMLVGQKSQHLRYSPSLLDTLCMGYIQSSPLVINELYYCGCRSSAFYYYDQFIELYNASNDTIFLDGYVMGRGTHYDNLIDFDSVDYAIAYYLYQFPGTRGVTRQCPIAPKQFMVLACDAIDHTFVFHACQDMSDADYEFCNPQEHDWCSLPSSRHLYPVTAEGKDFTMNLGMESVFIATGEGYYFQQHINDIGPQDYIHVPIETILDGVEYASNPDADRCMSREIDASLIRGVPKYSARSVERRYPGLDSNNGAFDFEEVEVPTPGYHH